MSSLPARWRPLDAYLQILLAPLGEAGAGACFLVEAGGPDGRDWTSIEPRALALDATDPARAAARAVAVLCGATRGRPDPGPEGQRGRGIYYVPSSFLLPKRSDANVAAIGTVVLDIDDRDHGGRRGTLRALGCAPTPTAVVHSGGGIQAAYVLKEAVVLHRTDGEALAAHVRSYVSAALALQAITDADDTAWPSHLFRCPGTYHLKDPARPVLVGVDLDRERRFNLSDFEALAGAADSQLVTSHTSALVDRLLGRRPRSEIQSRVAPLPSTPGAPGERPKFVLPRRISPAIVRLLNEGRHPKYTRRDGTLDRSRAVYAAALSLLAAGLDQNRVASVIAASALRAALDDRGDDSMRWLSFQIDTAREYLAKGKSRGRVA